MAISLQWIVLLLKFKGVFGLFCLRNTAKMYFQEISVNKNKSCGKW